MEDKDVILEAMRKAGEPLNAGKVAELTGLDRKAVDKAFAAMKKTGEIVSPVRCHPAKVLSPTLRISQMRGACLRTGALTFWRSRATSHGPARRR